MKPVLGREVEEGEEFRFVPAEGGYGLRVLGLLIGLEPRDGLFRGLPALGPHDLVERRLGLGM